MSVKNQYGDIKVTVVEGYVAQCELQRGPNNFFDQQLISDLADCFADIDKSLDVRAIVLCSEGKHFCAGNNFSESTHALTQSENTSTSNPLYTEAVRLFDCETPVVAAVQGAAIGGGLGLAMMADFRVLCPESRMSANFVKIGITPGFGLTHTLPRIIGLQKANFMLLTGRRISGTQAFEWGLGDVFTDTEDVRTAATTLAREIAGNAPLAVVSLREQMRPGLAATVKATTDIEGANQHKLKQTNDHKEGVTAVAERRPGNFTAS